MSGRVAYYGDIVKDGLILDLDVGKKDSYNKINSFWDKILQNYST